jgi:hypothetical protein
MTFSRAKPAGWSTGERFTSTQANTIDLNQSRAVDGNAGGTYTPSAAINITGANGLGDIDVTGQADFTAAVNFTGNVTWTGTSNLPKLGSRSYAYTQSLIAAAGDSEWIPQSIPGYRTNNNATTYQLYLNLDNLPYLGTITGVTAYVQGKGGHVGLPGTMPRVKLSYRAHGTDVVTDVAQQTDTSANTTAYQAVHTIALTGVSEVVNGARMYFAEVQSEGGANALDFFQLHGLTVTCTVTEIAP